MRKWAVTETNKLRNQLRMRKTPQSIKKRSINRKFRYRERERDRFEDNRLAPELDRFFFLNR